MKCVKIQIVGFYVNVQVTCDSKNTACKIHSVFLLKH